MNERGNNNVPGLNRQNSLSWPWFILGCLLFVLAIILVVWTFIIGELTVDQRYILQWLLPLVSGFTCGCFTGSIKSTGKISIITVAATGGFAVWILNHYLIPPPLPETFIQSFKVQNVNNELIKNGSISLQIGQTSLREPLNENSEATFKEIPFKFRNDSFQVYIDIKRYELLEPEKKYVFKDSQIEVIVKKSKFCIKEMDAIITDSDEFKATLDIVLNDFKEKLQSSYSRPIFLVFSNYVIKNNIHQTPFKLFRKVKKELTLCELLSDIEGQYNRSNSDRMIRIYISCDTILVAFHNEQIEKGGYFPCTPRDY